MQTSTITVGCHDYTTVGFDDFYGGRNRLFGEPTMMVVVNTTTEVGGCHDYIVHQGSRVSVVVERGFLGECMTSTATVVKTTIEV
jgi:hypothetical protein